jgi:GDP/UDP-N,N'-diacetylbacillosamine 2-epimerase (hydrolysing)
MRKFSVFSGSRSEYGLLKSLLKKLDTSKNVDLNLIISGSHFLKGYGNTFQEIKNDKIKISKKIYFKGIKMSHKNLSKNVLNLISDLSNYLASKRPDALILLGDRYETFIAAVAGVISKIKIIHIHGGELTFGSRDDLYRHAITKMANYHFVSTESYKKRLRQIGENKNNIFKVGALCNDNIKKIKTVNKNSLEKILKTNFFDKNILVSIHPDTQSKKRNIVEINKIFKIFSKFKNCKFFFSAPNSDENSDDIIIKIKTFCKKNKNTFYKASFGHELFLKLIKRCDLVIGNSSSGIIEAPLLGTPSINIGDRQKGRVRAVNTYDCKIDQNKMIYLMKKILRNKRKKFNLQKNPYYGNNVSNKIYKILNKINFNNLNHKYFRDIKFQ